MTQKKYLTLATIALACLAISLAVLPFFASLKPSARTYANLPRVDLSAIHPGDFQRLAHPVNTQLHHGYEMSLLVYRAHDGSFHLWDVLSKDGAIGMPDISWWRPMYLCKDFSPSIEAGRVDESQPITCHDKPLPSQWWANEWRWSINGQALGSQVDDMQHTVGTLEGEFFVFGKRS